MQQDTARVGKLSITLEGELNEFSAILTTKRLQDDLYELTLTLTASEPARPPAVKLAWRFPAIDIGASWTTAAGRGRGLNVDWGKPMAASSTNQAPVLMLHSFSGMNRLTFACSDALNPTELMAGIVEETGEFSCYVGLLQGLQPPVARYEATLRIDTRAVDYAVALKEVSDWWASFPDYAPAFVPDIARLPMYSTWYSFHQNVDPDAIVKQCRLAKQLGCETVIVDDGWQTNDGSRGYAFCGDWKPIRVPQMRNFVDRVHDTGLAFILWYSVPFIGIHSDAFKRFEGKYLFHSERMKASVLDPRFPEVREYLIMLYENALTEWNLDGFKLDFVDSFQPTPQSVQLTGEGRDYASVHAAADRLLADVISRLRAIKPQIMIEFRQNYIGPLMRKYGNLFRAGDCPNDAMTNRVRTLDLRLLAGNTAVHADMMMWNADEPPECAALQILNVLFSVPQVSVLLDKITPDQQRMVGFWLSFWREHRDVLLDGEFRPAHPESLFPYAVATSALKQVVVIYDDAVAEVDNDVQRKLFVVNATRGDRVVVRLRQSITMLNNVIKNCCGDTLTTEKRTLPAGIHELNIPAAGLAIIG